MCPNCPHLPTWYVVRNQGVSIPIAVYFPNWDIRRPFANQFAIDWYVVPCYCSWAMTLEQATRDGLDVYFFNTEEQRARFMATFPRTTYAFEHTYQLFTLHGLACEQRAGEMTFTRAR